MQFLIKATVFGLLFAAIVVLAPSSALALDRGGVFHYWSGTVSLDYTVVQDGNGSEGFEAMAAINATSDQHSPYSPSLIAATEGKYFWELYGSVEGNYADTSSSSCLWLGVPNPEFEQPPLGINYIYDQAFQIFGPKTPDEGGEYILGDMSVHLIGTEDCGDGQVPWNREHAPFPDMTVLDYLGVNNVNLVLATSGVDGPTRTAGGGFRWIGSKTYTGNSDFATYTAKWDYDLTYKDDAAPCALKAASPQRARNALVVRVLGNSSGCLAKLKTAKLKVGKKVYVFIRKHPERRVSARKTWRVEIPLSGKALETVQAALKRGKAVKAKAEFDLDGKTESVVVKIR